MHPVARRREAVGRRPGALAPPGLAAVASLVGLAVLAAGCGGTSRRLVRVDRDLVAPGATERAQAVAVVGRQHDLSRVPDLIEMLDDPDPGVRLLAGATLRDLTGRDSGYEAWAPPEQRRAQVLDWRRWWSARGPDAPPVEGTPPPVTRPSPPPAPPPPPPPPSPPVRASGAHDALPAPRVETR
jgi:hypothetical protein